MARQKSARGHMLIQRVENLASIHLVRKQLLRPCTNNTSSDVSAATGLYLYKGCLCCSLALSLFVMTTDPESVSNTPYESSLIFRLTSTPQVNGRHPLFWRKTVFPVGDIPKAENSKSNYGGGERFLIFARVLPAVVFVRGIF